MNIKEKLQIIQKMSGLTQTKLAGKLGVSFVAFNNWWTGKSKPRKKAEEAINELFKECTGQKIVPENILIAKKEIIAKKSKERRNILKMILNNPDILNEFLLSLTYNSNKIEGSTLSENETADIMFNNVSIPNKSLIEQLEVKNHQAALQYLFSYLINSGKINEELLLKLHGILINGIRDDAGVYRRHAVRIVGTNVPTANYLKVPTLMRELAKEIIKKHKNIITHVSYIHSRFEQIHPFADGNGRIGRLLMNAMLLKANIAPAVIKQEKKRLYYTFLNKAQTKDDYSQLEDFICEAVLEGFKILERKL